LETKVHHLTLFYRISILKGSIMMKRFFLNSLITVAMLTNLASADILITEVMSSSSHPGGTSNADWFELTNNGSSVVDITGWSWDDDSNTPGTANFGSITSIAPGESIIVTGETVGQEAAWRTDWNVPGTIQIANPGNTPGLSSGGDTLYVYDNTNTQVTTLTFGVATTGFSFEWDPSGNSLGLSVAGQNGAYVAPFNGAGAAGSDVGSPGIAIPEPGSFAVLLAGFAMLGSIRRRI
jgi:hypothetical protein